MLTGTPLDLTPFGPLLSALGGAYVLLGLVMAGLAIWLPKARIAKAGLTLAVLVAFIYPLTRRPEPVKPAATNAGPQLAAAMALFADRCKSAGEKIARTVENVDGVVWMRWREKYSNADNFADQFKLNDPFGRDCGAEDCIANLLRVTSGSSLNPEEAQRHRIGYRFVETVDPVDERRYRYSAQLSHQWTQIDVNRHRAETGKDVPSYSYRFTLDRTAIQTASARYGITWEDISTQEDREHWIAGGSLRVIDLLTNEVLGERIGYMVDAGQGSQVGFRSPWLEAVRHACPAFPANGPSDVTARRDHVNTATREFAVRILKPSLGD